MEEKTERLAHFLANSRCRHGAEGTNGTAERPETDFFR